MSVVVIGQVACDVVVHGSDTWSALGGKGANVAVALSQLDVPVTLVGVVGEDETGSALLEQAEADGLDVRDVVRRGRSAVIVERVGRSLDERIPDEARVRPDDVRLDEPTVVVAVLPLPEATLQSVLEQLRPWTELVVDGAAPLGAIARATVVRADESEAEQIAGRRLRSAEDAEAAAHELRGPSLVALATGHGDLVAWRRGSRFVPHQAEARDRTGAGDSFTAGLVRGWYGGMPPEDVALLAAQCAASTAARIGARPDLASLRP